MEAEAPENRVGAEGNRVNQEHHLFILQATNS